MRLRIGVILFMGILVAGCSGIGSPTASRSLSSAPSLQGSGPAQSSGPNIDIEKLSTTTTTAQTALTNAKTALDQLFSGGGFNFAALLGGVNFGNLSTCVTGSFSVNTVLFLPGDIGNALSCIFSDVITAATGLNTDLNVALAQLNAALALVPSASTEATEIQAMITQVTGLQASYVTMVRNMGNQINLAMTFLNELPTLATAVCPIPIPGLTLICGAAVSLALAPIENAITSFQVQLEAI